jgi:hypothetical protein
MLALSFLLIYVTPQIKEILMHIKNQNQVASTKTRQQTVIPIAVTKF